jgi:hypothetical protein
MKNHEHYVQTLKKNIISWFFIVNPKKIPVCDQYSTRLFKNICFMLKVRSYGVWEEFSSKKGETSRRKNIYELSSAL